MVTARMTSPVTAQVPAAATSAVTTIHVAQRSASRTIFALPASADFTSSIMRAMELSAPVRVARISKAPNWLTVPLRTSSPAALSTGSDSPVMTDSSMEVCPEVITPSAGTVSPGSTRSTSCSRTSSAGIVSSPEAVTRLAVRGVRSTSFSMPERALATVRSSSSAPSCMMTATSPAAKYSPMMSEAMSASDTSTSALMSNSVASPMSASMTMGAPQSTTAIQAGLKGRTSGTKKLVASAIAEMTRNAISRFVPPHSSAASSPLITGLSALTTPFAMTLPSVATHRVRRLHPSRKPT